MKKPIELLEMPFISDDGNRAEICGICGGCTSCKGEIDTRLGVVAIIAIIF